MQNQLQKNMSKEDSPMIKFESYSQFYIELIMTNHKMTIRDHFVSIKVTFFYLILFNVTK